VAFKLKQAGFDQWLALELPVERRPLEDLPIR